MKVILLQDVASLGKRNEIKDVASGYARNFLLPRKLVVIASLLVVNGLKRQKDKEVVQNQLKKKEYLDLQKKLEKIEIKILRKTTDKGKLFGSVGAKDIVQKIEELMSVKIDEAKIKLKESIKRVGEYKVSIELTKGVEAQTKILVTSGD